MSFVRRYVREKIVEEWGITERAVRAISAVDKLIDLNLDIFTSFHREEEFKLFLTTGKLERFFIENLKRFSWLLDFFLIVSLLTSSLLIIFGMGTELYHVISGSSPLKEGVLSLLGSLLILYALSELISQEIKSLKGAPFHVSVFLGVALAAVIREILILSVSHADVTRMLSMGFLLLALGVVYWVISKETKST